ncbi:mannitol dehydrogenase family protein [Streptomyces sp. NPDC005336]|uniref:mannitol dehydrogenase family protein n=1 Tax=Streptomyces sp. NPDC005336 TaxID=3157035 RepID=UPI0033AA5351
MAHTTHPDLPLTNATLPALAGRVAVPTYDRAALRPGLVHFGVGGFHRAHQAVYLDELAERGVSSDWGITGVGLHNPAMSEVMKAQDCLYMVVARGPDEDRARVVGAMREYLFGGESSEPVFDALVSPETRLVTLTITGSGYLIDPHTGEFDTDDENVAADLEDPGNPDTVFGYLVESLDRRRRAGTPPFTVLSCDNMQHNGHAARTATVSLARLRDERLGDWVDRNVAFPGCMVDRITPHTTPEERDAIVATFGVEDRWPVITEPFSQWVVEDRFCNERPPLDSVGVQFVDDVEPYELVKTRLLNGSHFAFAYLGYLAGYRLSSEVMADPVFHEYVATLMRDEVAPLLPQPPGMDLAHYQRTLLERFANPKIPDQLARLCRRGSQKMPMYVLPSIREARDRRRPHRLLTLSVAGWFRYLRGRDYAGEEVPVEGPMRDTLLPLAEEAGDDPRPLLDVAEVFGDLGKDPRFVAEVTEAVQALREGPREAVTAYLAAAGEPGG